MNPIPERVYQRVIHWADRDEVTGCLISRYSVGSHGYAQIGWKAEDRTTMTLCHLAVWRYHHGPTPDGMTVDHICHVQKCVELEHLRLLTNAENAKDNGQVRSNPGVGRFCGCGEEFVKGKGRQVYCRSCQNRRRRARRAAGSVN